MRVKSATVVAFVVCFVLSLAPPAAAATPAPTSTVMLPGTMTSMAVDPTHDHLFVHTQDANLQGSVEVYDHSGQLVRTIGGYGDIGPTGASSAAPGFSTLIPAAGEVFLAEPVAGAVERFDTSSLTASTLVTGLDRPYYLAYSGGYLWTTTGDDNAFFDQTTEPTLVRIDPATGASTDFPTVSLKGVGLVAGSGLPNTLFSFDPDYSPTSVERINLAGASAGAGPPVVTATGSINAVLSDLAVTPDGSAIVAPAASYEGFGELSTADLAPIGVMFPDSMVYRRAEAVTSQDGGLFAGGGEGDNSTGDHDVAPLFVDRVDDPSDQLFSYELQPAPGNVDASIVDRGLAFSADGTRLFAVNYTGYSIADPDGQHDQLSVFDLPGTPPPALPEGPAPWAIAASGMTAAIGALRALRRRRLRAVP